MAYDLLPSAPPPSATGCCRGWPRNDSRAPGARAGRGELPGPCESPDSDMPDDVDQAPDHGEDRLACEIVHDSRIGTPAADLKVHPELSLRG